MNVRLMILSTVVVSATLFALSAKAHDSEAVPTTCAQLADSHSYSNDVANPDIKALKARCDAEKKAAAAKPKATTKKAASKTK